MGRQRIEMYKLRRIINLYYRGETVRGIHRKTGVSRKTIDKHLQTLRSSGKMRSEIELMSDVELSELLYKSTEYHTSDPRIKELAPLLSHYCKELKKRHVTVVLLYEEYKTRVSEPYCLSQFSMYINRHRKKQDVTMLLNHKYGEYLYVDYAGDKLEYVEVETGEVVSCEIFVAILPASQLIYVEAQRNQRKESFVEGCQNALHYYGGVPEVIMPDNLKSAVIKSSRYDPKLNRTFAHFLEHYGTVGIPTRVARPRDKALVEGAVSIIYKKMYYPIRQYEPHSLEELNEQLWRHLERLNHGPLNGGPSRYDEFNKYERSELQPLPEMAYEHITEKKVTVGKNGHITLHEDRHKYSVPYHLAGKKVTLCYTNEMVRVYYKLGLVAEHDRNYRSGRATTIQEHLSEKHRFVYQRNPKLYLKRAAEVGQACQRAIEHFFTHSAHPEEAYRKCDGVLNQLNRYSPDALEEACGYILATGMVEYDALTDALRGKLSVKKEPKSVVHRHVRGSTYYSNETES